MTLTLIFTSILISASGSCDFQSAFQKGASDVETKSYGANLDQFCLGLSEEQQNQFKKWYEIGREKGPELKKLGVTQTPSSIPEANGLLATAQIQHKLDEIADRAGAILQNTSMQVQLIQELKDQNQRLAYDSQLNAQQKLGLKSRIDELQRKLNSVQ